ESRLSERWIGISHSLSCPTSELEIPHRGFFDRQNHSSGPFLRAGSIYPVGALDILVKEVHLLPQRSCPA
ncbi:hypothetical protein A1O3_06151, partial [Capronia epimyces CBS 606.96]